MNADAVLKELRAISKESTAKIYSRRGIRDVILGASYAGIGAIVKKLDSNFPHIQKTAAHRAKRKRR